MHEKLMNLVNKILQLIISEYAAAVVIVNG